MWGLQAEQQLKATAAENEAIAREVGEMRSALQRLQALKVTPTPDARLSAKVLHSLPSPSSVPVTCPGHFHVVISGVTVRSTRLSATHFLTFQKETSKTEHQCQQGVNWGRELP